MDLDDAHTRTLLAVYTQTHPTVRSVAAEIDRSVTVTYRKLQRLRAEGLVAWEDGQAGTLRPLVAEVFPVAPVLP
jgi:predicted transcriptional regulator